MSRWILLLTLAVTLGACDDAFTPRVDDGRAFALYGILNGQSTRQELRVQDLAETVLTTPDRLAATVTSTELTTGQTTVWRDSLITLPDGVRAHLYVADLAVAAGETHRIDAVRNADGAQSSVTVALPLPVVTSGPPPLPTDTVAPVLASNLGDRLNNTSFRYLVRRPADATATTFSAPVSAENGPGGGSFLAFLASAEDRARDILYDRGEGDLVFVGALLEGLMVSAAPAPVQQGIGGVGWTVPISISIPFTVEAVTRVGFVDGR